MRQTRTVIELTVGSLSADELVVRRVHGVEHLSAPYAVTVHFSAASGDFLALEELLGQQAAVCLRRPDGGSERHLHGVVWQADMAGVSAGKPTYAIRIVPRLERLKSARQSRIFQSLSVPEIVQKVLDEHGVKARQSLSGNHPRREYCVQYRETDFQFVSRLLEDEGIFYWFEHGPSSHVMVLADSTQSCVDLQGGATFPYMASAGVGDTSKDEHLFELERQHSASIDRVELRDYDFERPDTPVDGSKESTGRVHAEVYEYAAGFVDPGVISSAAQVRLEEAQVGARPWTGSGTCLRFCPGSAFKVKGHDDASFNEKLLLVGVTHRGVQRREAASGSIEHGYGNRFLCVEATVPYRPVTTSPWPAATTETATVVGPAGEEIWVDKYGRVRVQFHWDRDGKDDDHSSCWMRVGQSWAGAAWGANFIPRIGQEVLVKFLDGDPDRPFVAGALYNGRNGSPIDLPADKSKSTVRSASSLGSDGSNEVRFEDAKGLEEFFVHGQKDETIEILDDKTQQVLGSEALLVEKDRSIEVKGYQDLSVDRDDSSRVGMNQKLTVAGDRDVAVGHGDSESVGAARACTVAGERSVLVNQAGTETIGAAAALTIGGAYAVTVGGAHNTAVGGLLMRQVGGARVEFVGLSRDEQVADDSSAKVGKDFKYEVGGSVSTLTEKDQNEDVSGKTGIEAEQPIGWMATEFSLDAKDFSIVVGGKLMLSVKSGNVKLAASAITLDGKTVTVKGSNVKKVAGEGASSKSPKVEKLKSQKSSRASAKVKVTDSSGKPAANVRVKVKMPDGSVTNIKTDAAGNASISPPKEGSIEISLPDLDDSVLS